jgi:hypothetical protein
MSFFKDFVLATNTISFRSETEGIWFFTNATVVVRNNEIIVSSSPRENAVRFEDLSTEDKLGKANAIELVDEWAARGYLGSGTGGGELPASIAVIGTVGVNNFPASQVVSGAVSISNFQDVVNADPTFTDIDLKQTKDNLPLFFSRVVFGTATQTYQIANSSTDLQTVAIGDYAIAQTFMRFNYQTGKPKKIILTQSRFDAQAGVSKRFGYFNGGTIAPHTNYDGLYLLVDVDGSYSVCIANNGVIQSYPRSGWLDKLDGTGPSGITIDWMKAPIVQIIFLWLGYGPVEFSILVNGEKKVFFFKDHTNILDKPYMLSPCQPICYEVRGPGGILTHTCATVGNIGGIQNSGVERGVETEANLSFASAGTNYLMIGMRLKSTHLDVKIDLLRHEVLCSSNDDFVYSIILNPTIAGTTTFTAQTNSALEIAIGIPANTITGGTVLHVGIGRQSIVANNALQNVLRLGASIAGARDVVALCFKPLSAGASAYAIINTLQSN